MVAATPNPPFVDAAPDQRDDVEDDFGGTEAEGQQGEPREAEALLHLQVMHSYWQGRDAYWQGREAHYFDFQGQMKQIRQERERARQEFEGVRREIDRIGM